MKKKEGIGRDNCTYGNNYPTQTRMIIYESVPLDRSDAIELVSCEVPMQSINKKGRGEDEKTAAQIRLLTNKMVTTNK